jgi:hypothetical protein
MDYSEQLQTFAECFRVFSVSGGKAIHSVPYYWRADTTAKRTITKTEPEHQKYIKQVTKNTIHENNGIRKKSNMTTTNVWV